jgi:uncharacterized membrane protein
VALYQLGAIPHLPDPPLPLFDSDRITQSQTAHPFGIPDSLLGIASYTVTLVLLIEAPRSPLIRKLAAMKLMADGGMAAANAVRQVVVFKKVCSWCLVTAAATGAMLFTGRRYLR